jgi:hypothetical protein
MKFNLSFFLVLIVTSFIFSCSNSDKTEAEAETTNTEVVTEETESKPRPKKNNPPSQRLSVQFEELGLSLSPEQVTQIDAIAANYNFAEAKDRDARKTIRQAFQKEIFDNVLTEEQQNAYNQSRESRKAE